MDPTIWPLRRIVYILALHQIIFNADRCAFESMIRDQDWSLSTRDDIVMVVELSQRRNEQHMFHLVTGAPKDDLQGQARQQRGRTSASQEGGATNVDNSHFGKSCAVDSQESRIGRTQETQNLSNEMEMPMKKEEQRLQKLTKQEKKRSP